MNNVERKALLTEYASIVSEQKKLAEKLTGLKERIYLMDQDTYNQKEVGSFTINDVDSGFKIKVTKKNNLKVDQTMASVVEVGFRKKYEVSATEYKKLSDADKKRVDECVTSTPGTPSFSVEPLEI